MLGPMTAKPFVLTIDQMMENGKLEPFSLRVVAANAYNGDTTQFEILREWLEPELGAGLPSGPHRARTVKSTAGRRREHADYCRPRKQ